MVTNLKAIGQCEVCDKPDVEVINTMGNIKMCADCKAEDDKVVLQTKAVTKIIEDSIKVDTSIQIKTDLFNAATVAAVELKAAIDNNPSIPADQKDYEFTKLCFQRFEHFSKVAFDKHAEYVAAENEKRAWQVQTQTSAGKLRAEFREKFKNFDINYQPAVVKTPKPKEAKPKAKSNIKEVKAAASKYGVDASAVQMMVLKRNLDAETAAKELATLLGKITN